MTVEAALVMPVVLAVILTSLWFCFHVYNRTVLALSCGEQAVSGHEQEAPMLVAAGEVKISREDSVKERSIGGESETIWYAPDNRHVIAEKSTYQKVKPVAFMRRAYAVIELTEGE
ncbi:MAG: pilus assembly protein [Lachnospiraceae bacterium]|nr:pilus assembly protein [Lachnospiraceae bacterium]